jgi:autotransporter family porin
MDMEVATQRVFSVRRCRIYHGFSCHFFPVKISLRLSILVGCLSLCVNLPVQAACSNNFPSANINVVCTGVDTTGVYASGNNVNVTVQPAASVTDAGYGVSLLAASSATNSGTINGGSRGVSLGGVNSTVTNTSSGIISAVTGIGMDAIADGTMIINSGQITGTTFGIASNVTSPGTNGITVINNATGTITGPAGIFLDEVAGALEVDNYGTISSTTGALGTAVSLFGPQSTVLIGPGAVFTGAVMGQAGSNNTLTLAGTGTGNFNLGQLGPALQYQNFTQLVKDNTSTWTVTGTNTLPWTVKNGVLNVASGASMGGTVAINQGTVNLTASNSTIGGNVTLASAGVLTGVGSVTGDVSNGGAISPGLQVPNPTAANVGALTIQGNYTGTGGRLTLRTQLGGDNSPTDQLIINGADSVGGVTSLYITSLPGSVGAMDVTGIPIIVTQNDGPFSSFVLAQPVEAGAYQYVLRERGNTWYLFSSLLMPQDNRTPLYRPSISAYAIGNIDDLEYGFSSLGDLHERVGDLSNLHCIGKQVDQGTWGRIVVQNLRLNTGLFTAKNNYIDFLQVGQDLPVSKLPWFALKPGRNHTGVMLTLGSIQGDFYDPNRPMFGLDTRTSKVAAQSAALGLYWTHYWNHQSYVDAIAQGNYYQNHYKEVCAGCAANDANQRGWGQILSLEGGYPIPIPVFSMPVAERLRGWEIEPEAQLAYQHLGLSAFNDAVSNVSAVSDNVLRARLGLRFSRQNTLPIHCSSLYASVYPYFVANLYRDFTQPSGITVGGIQINNSLNKTWGEVGGGLTAPLMKYNLYTFADIRYQTSFSGNREGFQGILGLRLSI